MLDVMLVLFVFVRNFREDTLYIIKQFMSVKEIEDYSFDFAGYMF